MNFTKSMERINLSRLMDSVLREKRSVNIQLAETVWDGVLYEISKTNI